MGGPIIKTHFGRVDAQAHSEGVDSAAGRLPDGDQEGGMVETIRFGRVLP